MNNDLKKTVIKFVAEELAVSIDKLDEEQSLFHDFGVAGDDGAEFVSQFCERFNVPIGNFDSMKYFGEEASGNIFSMLLEVITRRNYHNTPRLTIKDLIITANEKKLVISEG